MAFATGVVSRPTGNLDTTTGAEIMETFARLNREQGVAIVLVTHEESVARAAHRILWFRDGEIQRDEHT